MFLDSWCIELGVGHEFAALQRSHTMDKRFYQFHIGMECARISLVHTLPLRIHVVRTWGRSQTQEALCPA